MILNFYCGCTHSRRVHIRVIHQSSASACSRNTRCQWRARLRVPDPAHCGVHPALYGILVEQIITVDREIFAALNFRLLNFSAFNFRHLASTLHCRYSAKIAHLIFVTRVTGEKILTAKISRSTVLMKWGIKVFCAKWCDKWIRL